ncbi:MAG TPA: CHAT domain-containing protein [Candidatus Limnocylindrales bacterium]|nr:CHAT domain-containing protein [Candidatus Limnocylindrales bacterium]
MLPIFVIFLWLLIVPGARVAAQDSIPTGEVTPGAVIEKFEDEFAGPLKAGMKEGDVLLSWKQGDRHGEISSPWDINVLVVEMLPRGPVVFRGRRGQNDQEWTVTKLWWGTRTRFNFNADWLDWYLRAAGMRDQNQGAAAARMFLDRAKQTSSHELAAWLQTEAGRASAAAQTAKESDEAFRLAAQTAETLPGASRAALYLLWAEYRYNLNEVEGLEAAATQALQHAENAHFPFMQFQSLNWLSGACGIRGDVRKGFAYALRSHEIAYGLDPESYTTGSSFVTLGAFAWDMGDISGAESYFLKALPIFERKGPHTLGKAYLLLDLSELAKRRGDLGTAATYMADALKLHGEIDNDSRGYSTLLNEAGELALAMNRFDDAKRYGEESLALARKLSPQGSAEEADTLQSLGKAAKAESKFESAQNLWEQSLALRRKLSQENHSTSETHLALGDLLARRGDLDGAEAHYREALRVQRNSAPGTSGESSILGALARLAQKRGDQDAAIRLYAEAIAALEEQETLWGGSPEHRTSQRTAFEPMFREYADLLVNHHDFAGALAVLDASKARTLLEGLADWNIDVRQGVPKDLLLQEQLVRAEIRAKSEKRLEMLRAGRSDREIGALEKELQSLDVQRAQVSAQILASSPAYGALTRPRLLSAQEIQQQLLDRNTLLLEYSLGDQQSYVFAVSTDSVQVFPLPERAIIAAQARRLYEQWSSSESTTAEKNESADPEDLAQELARAILGPLQKQLGRKRIVIIADDALHYVPFAALPDPSAKGGEPLALNHEIVYLPSASVLAELRTLRNGVKPAEKYVAVLADPVFDAGDSRVKLARQPVPPPVAKKDVSATASAPSMTETRGDDTLVRSATDFGMTRSGGALLPRLLFSRREAEGIRAATSKYPSSVRLDFNASRKAVLDPELGQYRIVHFATHGLVNNLHPEFSGLVLSLVDRDGRAQDGFLSLQDIYNLKLTADLVVLSACNTALGKEVRGEGLVGLTRGFMHAGTNRVVASLWKVSDAATAELMTEFYRGMTKDALTPAAALRQAQITLWREKRWHSPYYWAAFQIEGEWQ